MRLKLDENLGSRACDLLHAAGHEVSTVKAEGLGAAMDDEVLQAAVGEEIQKCEAVPFLTKE